LAWAGVELPIIAKSEAPLTALSKAAAVKTFNFIFISNLFPRCIRFQSGVSFHMGVTQCFFFAMAALLSCFVADDRDTETT
jgi:hypothetical protein